MQSVAALDTLCQSSQLDGETYPPPFLDSGLHSGHPVSSVLGLFLFCCPRLGLRVASESRPVFFDVAGRAKTATPRS